MDSEVMRLKSRAESLRVLKRLGMQEARRYASMRDRLADGSVAKNLLAGCVTAFVGDARKWSKMQVAAQVDLRILMLDRRLARFIASVPVDRLVLSQSRAHQ
jgi:hypothetical protein